MSATDLQIVAPPANEPYQPVVLEDAVIGSRVYIAGNAPIVRGCHAQGVRGATIVGGLPNRPWDRLAESCIRNGVIEDCTFVGCGVPGADDGVVLIPRQLTGWLTIRRCTFVDCHSVCIYFDDLASGVYAPIVIEQCTFVNCEQAILIGGGRGFVIRDVTEIGSAKASVIDDRAQISRTSRRSCKWGQVAPDEPYVTPWEQAKLEFQQMGIQIDLPALAETFHTGGTIERWRCRRCPAPEFLDGAEQFWVPARPSTDKR